MLERLSPTMAKARNLPALTIGKAVVETAAFKSV